MVTPASVTTNPEPGPGETSLTVPIPTIVRLGVFTSTFSTYVPGHTRIVVPGAAASTACWIVNVPGMASARQSPTWRFANDAADTGNSTTYPRSVQVPVRS